MTPAKTTKTEPQIMEMPAQKMAVVLGKGAPDKVFPKLMPVLFGSAYMLKFELKKQGREFKVTGLRARYPDAHLVPIEEWTHVIALPIPEDTIAIPQKVAGTRVEKETWEYGTVAQILHIGPYDQVLPAVERLHQFIKDNGFEITGPYEEEYLTRPGAKVQKTIIRYEIRKR